MFTLGERQRKAKDKRLGRWLTFLLSESVHMDTNMQTGGEARAVSQTRPRYLWTVCLASSFLFCSSGLHIIKKDIIKTKVNGSWFYLPRWMKTYVSDRRGG